MYAHAAKDPDQALAAFKQALALAPEAQQPALLQRIPPAYRARLGYPQAAPQAPGTNQTSASKG
jgi:hypothetical protein